MFLTRRPSDRSIRAFLDDAQRLPLSYAPGDRRDGSHGYAVDEQSTVIGRGAADFERARSALRAWRQFDLGWADVFPRAAPAPGTTVAVLARHLGFWSLNGCRVTSVQDESASRFALTYATLLNHAETGAERFEVFRDAATGQVIYRIRAISRGRAVLARLGQPYVRLLQARFRRDSAAAMRRALHSRPNNRS